MSDDQPYSKREVDSIHQGLNDKMDLMLSKQDFTNGKVKKIIIGGALMLGWILGGSDVNLLSLLGLL